MRRQVEIIEKDQFEFDNLPDRPTRPTDADISNAMTPLPPLVRNGFFVGQVITMSGNQAPQGTLVCDGTVYNIEDYPDLANYYEASQGSKNFYGGDGETTFAVPDYRGEFLRGTGTNSHANQGNGASVGVHQDGTEVSSAFRYENQYIAPVYAMTGNQGVRNQDRVNDRAGFASISATFAESGGEGSGGMYATRPTNTSVLYCVVY